MKLIDVTCDNVEATGFFCKMSQRKSEGYRRKLAWLRERFAEGLRMKLLDLQDGGRGFIEYLPGEYAWRAVDAAGYLFIHCLWVVGASKGRGYGRLLLEQCIADAQCGQRAGVAMLTSEGNFLLGRDFLAAHGFVSAGHAPPSFELMVRRFGRAPLPRLPADWTARAARCGPGLTVFRTDQCPYFDDATDSARAAARQCGLHCNVVPLTSAAEIREKSPTAYGTFALVCAGRVISYHPTPTKRLVEIIHASKPGCAPQ